MTRLPDLEKGGGEQSCEERISSFEAHTSLSNGKETQGRDAIRVMGYSLEEERTTQCDLQGVYPLDITILYSRVNSRVSCSLAHPPFALPLFDPYSFTTRCARWTA